MIQLFNATPLLRQLCIINIIVWINFQLITNAFLCIFLFNFRFNNNTYGHTTPRLIPNQFKNSLCEATCLTVLRCVINNNIKRIIKDVIWAANKLNISFLIEIRIGVKSRKSILDFCNYGFI